MPSKQKALKLSTENIQFMLKLEHVRIKGINTENLFILTTLFRLFKVANEVGL